MDKRPHQITTDFKTSIDNHLDDLINNRVARMLEIEDFAELLCIHPTHLSNTIKDVTGVSACAIYQEKIVLLAGELLKNPNLTIRDIAFSLDFEPSQFTKWFRRLKGSSPKEYRKIYCS